MNKSVSVGAQTKSNAHSVSNSMSIEDVPTTDCRPPDRLVKPPTKRAIATAKAILQQWGHRWLSIDFLDAETVEFLKKSDPDLEKQR